MEKDTRTTIKVSKEVLTKMRRVAAMDGGKNTTEWLEWVVEMAHQCLRDPKPNPFQEGNK